MIASVHAATGEGFPAPLVRQAAQAALICGQSASRVPVLGIAGVQGSGKSTFTAQIAAELVRQRRRVAVLSLDDLYLTRAERERLARTVHPLLATRGPPGTHDVALGCDRIDALRDGGPVALPRFDKLSDDRMPAREWDRIDAPVDAILLEGWCLGTPAEADDALREPVNALERDEDADGTWRRHCNHALRTLYPALWSRMDALWCLQAPGFELVRQWRWQQEQRLAAAQSRAVSLDEDGVRRFVQFFERVSRHALATLPGIADRTIMLDARRSPVQATV